MKRRSTESLPGLDPAYFAAREKQSLGPLPKRWYGRTKEKLSISLLKRMPGGRQRSWIA